MKTRGVTIKPSLTHSQGIENRIEKFRPMSRLKKAPACIGDSSPVVRGLAFVRSTCLSMSRSQKSLIMHPAERQESAPTVKRDVYQSDGGKAGAAKARPQ